MGLLLGILSILLFLMAGVGIGSLGMFATAPLGAAFFVMAWLLGASLEPLLIRRA